MKRSVWANNWWQQALHDLDAAKGLRESGFWDTTCLLSQQAAEKALKGLWIDLRSEEPPKIHNVEKLASSLGAPKTLREAGNVLIGDYITSRYPDTAAGIPFQEYRQEDAENRIDLAEKIMLWVSEHWEECQDNG